VSTAEELEADVDQAQRALLEVKAWREAEAQQEVDDAAAAELARVQVEEQVQQEAPEQEQELALSQ
jgi:hypothetical protein